MGSPLFAVPSRPWRRRALHAFAIAGVLSCSTDALDPDRGTIASVVVSPDRLSVGVGASATLTAELRDAAGNLILGRKVVWASKDPSLATVTDGGVVSGVSPGPVQIAATAEGKTAVVDVTVNPKAVATIRLTPSGSLGLLVGQTRQMTAEPLDASGEVLADRPVTWSSNAPAIATVSEDGLITAVAPGGAVVTAASEGRASVVAVTVSSVPVASVSITPDKDNLVVTQTLQLTAIAKDAAGTPLLGRVISWATSDPARATVSSTGLVTGISPGEVTISAASDGKTGNALITVLPKPVAAVILSPAQFSVERGQTRQLAAQVTDDQGGVLPGRPVQYASDNPAIATVSATGMVTGVALGTTKITATSEGKTGTADVNVVPVPVASVAVTPPQANLTVGQSATFTAVARDAQGNVLSGRPVAWTTGAPSVATVSAGGVVVGVGTGNAVIFATVEGRVGSATVDVRQVPVTSVTVAPPSTSVAVGASVQLSATVRAGETVLPDRVVGWSSSNEAVAVVSSTGRVTGLKGGAVTITATSEGVSGTASVAVGVSSVVVTPGSATVEVGQTRQLAATARNASNGPIPGVTFQWTTTNAERATVSTSGLVTGVSAGPVTIRAMVAGVSGSSNVTVVNAPVASVTVAPASATIARGATVQLSATLKDAAGNVLTGRQITWSSSNSFVATVNSAGLVTASQLLTGTARITATSEKRSAQSTVRVTFTGQ
jgi:trimeric autotransporter adhesin